MIENGRQATSFGVLISVRRDHFFLVTVTSRSRSFDYSHGHGHGSLMAVSHGRGHGFFSTVKLDIAIRDLYP